MDRIADASRHSNGATLRVQVSLEHELMRTGLQRLLGEDERLDVIGAEQGLDAAVREAIRAQPDVLVAELPTSPRAGLDTLTRLSERAPDVASVIISPTADCVLGASVIAAGARGLVLKTDSFDELRRAINTVLTGRSYVCTAMRLGVRHAPRSNANRPDADVAGPLSRRELEVIRHIANGLSTREIADTLELSVKTIETHRSRIMDKLDIYTVAGLTKYALRAEITEP